MLGLAGPRAPGPKFGEPIAPNLNVRHLCPNCRSDPPNIIEEYSKGDLVCGDCGTILGDRIVDTRSEWRTFAGDEGGDDPSRVGDAHNALLKNNFETAISGLDGRTGMSANLQRAQARANAQGGTSRTTNAAVTAVFMRITEKCDALQLPRNVAARAHHIYKIIEERKVTRGKSENAVIAACIVLGSRVKDGTARTLNEISLFMQVPKKIVGVVLQLAKQALNDEVAKTGANHEFGNGNVSSESVEALIPRYCNHMNLSQTVLNAAKHVARLAGQKADIDGRNPSSIAAGVLYFICVLFGDPTNVNEISVEGRVSPSTIKLIVKKVSLKLDEVIKPEWKDKYPKGYKTLAALGSNGSSSSTTANDSTSRAQSVISEKSDGGKSNGKA